MTQPAANLTGIYQLFIGKSNEVLLLYYWSDEFFKRACQDCTNNSVDLSNKKKYTLEQWHSYYSNINTSHLPFDSSTHLKDIETYFDISLSKMQEIFNNLDSTRRELLCKIPFVYIAGLFEAFFFDSVELAFGRDSLKKMKDSGGFKKQVAFIEEEQQLRVDESELAIRISDIDEAYARRNLLLHCGGIVDSKYLNRVGISSLNEGDEVTVDEDYFMRVSYDFQALSRYICALFENREEFRS